MVISYFYFVTNLIILALNSISIVGIKNVNESNVLMSVMTNVVIIKYLNQKYIEVDSIAFTLKNILNPSKSSQTSSFQLALLDPFQNLVERQLDQLPYLTIPGTISNLLVQFSSNYLEEDADIWIQFSTENPLSSQGFLNYFSFI